MDDALPIPMPSRDDGEKPSGYEFYSLAISAHNKPLGEPICEVILQEVTAFFDGEVTDRGESDDFNFLDGNNTQKAGKQTTSASVPATWWCLESNRITPPDLRRNEQLIIFRFADTGELFWVPRNTNRNRRKLETVVHAWSGTTDETDDTVTEENHYISKMSTHDKQFLFSTSKKNGEVCRWFVQIRGDDGKFILCDDDGNEILVDSMEKIIRIINSADAMFELNNKDGNITLPGNYNLTVKGNATIAVTGKATISSASYDLSAADITFNGKTVFNGATTVNGPLTGQGATFSAMVTFNGGYTPRP